MQGVLDLKHLGQCLQMGGSNLQCSIIRLSSWYEYLVLIHVVRFYLFGRFHLMGCYLRGACCLQDQRGTGLSHAITCDGLKARDASEQVDYLSCFRADSIAKDCERVRQKLALSGKWSVIGQSYGGFCAMTYLSYFPDSIMEVFLTGGVPPGIRMNCSADMVYKSTFRKAIKQNEKFYARFPQAVAMAQKVVRFLMSSPDGRVVTPASNYLTPRSFQVLGINCLGFSSGFERLYYMLESAFDIDGNLSYKFLKEFDAAMPWDSNPLYAIMHENIYCQGNSSSDWAAHRVRGEYSALFDAEASVTAGNPVYFTGEMVFPWMFDDFAELRKIKQAAHAMATHTNWSILYLPETLSANTVPIAAACYYEDMFVSFELAQETLDMVGSARQYVTNDYLHDGIREQGGPIFEKLLNIVRGGALLR